MTQVVSSLGLLLFSISACQVPRAELEEGEWMPGGETTNVLLLGSNSFLRPAANLSSENQLFFYSGNSFFNQGWVEAPASTDSRDGLGPLFNARSCSGCHFRDGKAEPPDNGAGPFVGLLFRISVPGPDGPLPDEVYGSQFQDQAMPGVAPEVIPYVEWIEEEGSFEDGSSFSLISPSFAFEDLGYGPLPEDLMSSPRLAPHMVGLGLLEAIPEARLRELADPDDADGDGISGRIQFMDHSDLPGRFGWKAETVSVAEQVAGAFSGDMGLTTSMLEIDDCTEAQQECIDAVSGGVPEVEEQVFDRVVLYSQAIAVPVRRNADSGDVLRGKTLFNELECGKCHVASHVTGEAAIPELEGQLIWPYTDMLLHDMGEGLADHRPVGGASGREWRTPPLWGLGLVDDVGGYARFLHDGRARSLEEAILWHGGEAEASKRAYEALPLKHRAYVLSFLEDL
jgi:CxxC motif-containing protein (DUF1111 family)